MLGGGFPPNKLTRYDMIPIAKPIIGAEEIEAVVAVLKSGIIAQGGKVEEFEKEFARFIGTKYAVAVNSGTAALHVALLAHGIGEGDEVITTPFSFIATATSILFTGAKPVFADIDEDTYNLSVADVAKKLTRRTRAILPVDLYGHPCDMDGITKIAQENDLILVEDACQAHGAEYKGKKAGSFGSGCFSFYATKNIATGEGGMITTNDEGVADRSRMIRTHGQRERYFHEMLGYNYRMTDMAAAIGLCHLRKLEQLNGIRIENARFLTDSLKGITGLILPVVAPNMKHVFHQYTVRIQQEFGRPRDEVKEKLNQKGIMTEVHYPLPIHKQPLYQKLGYDTHLPSAEKAAREVLSLPVHPSLTPGDLKYIVESLIDCRGE